MLWPFHSATVGSDGDKWAAAGDKEAPVCDTSSLWTLERLERHDALTEYQLALDRLDRPSFKFNLLFSLLNALSPPPPHLSLPLSLYLQTY